MKRSLLAFACISLLATPAMAQSVGEKTGVNSVLGVAPKTEDFIREAAISDMTEIETAKIAMQRGNAEDKTFAETMQRDHTKTSTELKGLVPADMKNAMPTALDDSSKKKVDSLRDAKNENVSKDYRSMQVSAHKDAVSLFERYAKGGDNAQLKDWAGKTLPALQHHLKMAQDLNDKRLPF